QRLRHQRLAGSGWPNQQDVGLAQLDVAGLLVEEDALVVVVDGDGQLLFRAVLPDHIAVEELLDLRRAGQTARRRSGLLALLILEDGLANTNALVADVGSRIV